MKIFEFHLQNIKKKWCFPKIITMVFNLLEKKCLHDMIEYDIIWILGDIYLNPNLPKTQFEVSIDYL